MHIDDMTVKKILDREGEEEEMSIKLTLSRHQVVFLLDINLISIGIFVQEFCCMRRSHCRGVLRWLYTKEHVAFVVKRFALRDLHLCCAFSHSIM